VKVIVHHISPSSTITLDKSKFVAHSTQFIISLQSTHDALNTSVTFQSTSTEADTQPQVKLYDLVCVVNKTHSSYDSTFLTKFQLRKISEVQSKFIITSLKLILVRDSNQSNKDCCTIALVDIHVTISSHINVCSNHFCEKLYLRYALSNG
jgi:hypothetical protein